MVMAELPGTSRHDFGNGIGLGVVAARLGRVPIAEHGRQARAFADGATGVAYRAADEQIGD